MNPNETRELMETIRFVQRRIRYDDPSDRA